MKVMNLFYNLLSKKVENPTSILFYIAFILVSVPRMIQGSGLVNISDDVMDIFAVAACVAFMIKILLDKGSRGQFLLKILIAGSVVVLKNIGLPMFIVSSCFAFLAMKNVNIKTVIKIDLVIKLIFFMFSAFLFGVDYLTGEEKAFEYIYEAKKGTAMMLYFKNPNTAGFIGTMIAFDLLYLKDNKKMKDFVLPTIIAVITFVLTTSRAPFLVYCVYLLLQFIRNGKLLTIIQKLAFPILFAAAFYIASSVAIGSSTYDALNPFSSGRLWYSIAAYRAAGITILPSLANSVLLKDYIIDVFYVKCMVRYGLIVMLLYYVPHLILPVTASNEQKRMSIVASLYLFFEDAVTNIGFGIPYLIIADAIFNRETGEGGRDAKK